MISLCDAPYDNKAGREHKKQKYGNIGKSPGKYLA